MDVGNGQTEDGSGVQGELREILRDEGDQTGVVRAGGDLTENDVIAFDEKFHTKQTAPAEGLGDGASDALRCGDGGGTHRMGLPGFAVIPFDLDVTDGWAKGSAADVADGEHGDLVVELDKALDDDFAGTCAPAFLGVVPGG